MSTTDVLSDWKSLIAERSPAKRYFDPSHPLDLLYGADPTGKPVFVMLTSTKPEESPVSRDISMSLAQRSDGRWATSLRLEDSTLFASFSRLCLDLVARSHHSATETDAIKALFKALDEWKLLLRRFRPHRMSLSELRGLVAELWFGFTVLSATRGTDVVARSWTGPLKAAQDFTFLDDHLCEVKARRSSATTVGVASVEQLDPGAKSLMLAVVVLDDCDADAAGSFSLIELLYDIRSMEDLSFEGRSRLDKLLLTLGLNESDSYYAETHFTVPGFQEFDVNASFPSIRGATVDGLPVSHVRYDLAVDPLARWQLRNINLQDEGGNSE